MSRISKDPPKRTSNACNCCRKKKIKCNGMFPCINCINYNILCIYDSTSSGNLPSHRTPSIVSRLLSNLSNIGENEIQNDQSLLSEIDTLNTFLEQSLDKKKHAEEDNVNSSSVPPLSKETQISNTLRRNRFSKLNDTHSVVNSFFGLYTPVSLVSGPGFAWLVETLMKHSSDYDLKIFGKSELKNFLQSQFIKIIEDYDRSNVIWTEFLTLDDLMRFQLEEKRFIELVKKHCNHPNIKCYVSQSTLIGMVNDFFKDKQSCFQQKKYLLLFSFIVSACSVSHNIDKRLRSDCFKICIFIYKHSIFTIKNGVEFLIGLLQLLAGGLLKLHPESFESMLSEATEYAFKLGFNRRELYVGITETEADLRRSIMWDLYVLDKKNYLFLTRRMYIHDDDISCLYPNSIEEIIANPPQSITSILQKDKLSNYFAYYEIRLARLIFIIHSEYLSAGSSLKLGGNTEIFNKILKKFDYLRESMVLEIRPGSKIMSSSFSELDIWKISIFHVYFFACLLFMYSSFKTLPERAKPQYTIQTDYSRQILQIFLDVKRFNGALYLLQMAGLVVNAGFDLIEKISQSPLDSETSMNIEVLLNVRKNLSGLSSEDERNNFYQFLDLFLTPATKIFKGIYKDGISKELGAMIDDFLQKMSNENGISDNLEIVNQKSETKNLKEIDFNEHISNFLEMFNYTDPFVLPEYSFEGSH